MSKETPRTNAAMQSGMLYWNAWYSECMEWVPADFARQLERELTATKEPTAPTGFITTTELPPLALAENFGDPETLFNSREWLQSALEAKGAQIEGAGVGCGQADLSIVLDGCKFNVSIRPT